MATTLSVPPALEPRIAEARERLDAWTREMVQWHFSPETGAPFWLDYAAKLGWDPRREIRCYDDLDKLGFFQDEWLRGGPVSRWIPRGLKGKPIYVFETGGSTGVPKSRISSEDFRIDYELFSETLPDDGFPKGSDWIHIGPSGPRRLRLAVEHLAQFRGGTCFSVDLDPRWVIKLINAAPWLKSKPTSATSSTRRSPSSKRTTASSACSPRPSSSKPFASASACARPASRASSAAAPK
jgi:hypothetical protein